MRVFPVLFGGWINQNTQQPLVKDESKRSKNVKSMSEINTHEERDDTEEQLKLWRGAEKKAPWHDPPPKVKVTTLEGICFIDMELILGLPPQAAYNVLTNPDNQPYSRIINGRELIAVYMKKKMMFMKDFEGSWQVEPIFVDSQRLCKHRLPKSQEDYRQCSGGQGKIASKVKMNLTFMPSSPFNLPPVSWYIRGIVIKTTKTLLQDLQATCARIRGA
ncbi:uncharacterized protein LOC18992601 [Eutrema salsugineum]|uniref:uncharacterized protein LOC18992601 n=1 Tax=Eutrema salsugineum TaxID=72664 RepID=UPI000CED0106|nr:uncharacterized protein LOC18992601 [Eutrema salsugineum]